MVALVEGVVALVEGVVALVEGVVALVEGVVALVEGVVALVEGVVALVEAVVALDEGVVALVCDAVVETVVVAVVEAVVALDEGVVALGSVALASVACVGCVGSVACVLSVGCVLSVDAPEQICSAISTSIPARYLRSNNTSFMLIAPSPFASPRTICPSVSVVDAEPISTTDTTITSTNSSCVKCFLFILNSPRFSRYTLT